jgi:hypothetical protein
MERKPKRSAPIHEPAAANLAIRDALKALNALSKAAYGKSFAALVEDKNLRARNQRIRQLSGVMLKRDFSRQITHVRSDTMRSQWRIDPQALASKPATDWEFKILMASPVRQPGETGKNVAARLRRETHLGRAFVQTLHAYLCDDKQVRKQVMKALHDAGLAAFAGFATPKGLLKAGGASLYGVLLTALPNGVAAAGIAVAAVVVCTLGL